MSFARAVAYVLRAEGGYVNMPSDPGGETNFGISKRAYPDIDIKALTAQKAAQIYSDDFWEPIHGDQLPDAISFALLDFAVNSGVPAAIRSLQKVLSVNADGIMGPATVGSAIRADPRSVVERLSAERVLYLTLLPTWSTFGKGWIRRVISTAIEAFQ